MAILMKLRWTLILITLPFLALGQKNEIQLVNPSFEDIPGSGKLPKGWSNCGDPNETPPDVQPGQFSVTKAAQHGNSYLGLVVRDNDTHEGVSQRLPVVLKQNECYEWDIQICRSELYQSESRLTKEKANYTVPVRVHVYGGYGACDQHELLYETPDIVNTRWISYPFRLLPKKGSYPFITIKVYYRTPVLYPYNGHALFDNASPIRQIPCNPEPMIARKKKLPPADTGKKGTKPAEGRTSVASSSPKTINTDPNPVMYGPRKLKSGDILRLERLYFEADQYDIQESNINVLTELERFMSKYPQVKIEIRGHTNNLMKEQAALRLSTNRAKSVADWLISQGIPSERIVYKGYGWTEPIYPNTTEEGRRKNQRVEIRILSTNG